MANPKAELGALERQVMQLVWKHREVTADAVREQLPRSLKESTVRTVLKRLEAKGYVQHRIDNRTFVYSAVEQREHVAAKAVKRIVDWFCEGSVEEVLIGMVDRKMLNQRQLAALTERIAAAQKSNKSSKKAAKGQKN